MDEKLIDAFDNAIKTANDINKRLIVLCIVMAVAFGLTVTLVSNNYFNSLYVPVQTQEIENDGVKTIQNQNGGN